MRVILLLAVMALVTGASEPKVRDCYFISPSDETIRISAEGPWIEFQPVEGPMITCAYKKPQIAGDWFSVDCGKWHGQMINGDAQLGSGEADILVFQHQFFYRRCGEPA